MSTRSVQGLVVGGGPSGLAAAFALQGDTLILEKEARVGGLCRSIHYGGGVFDIGGHSFHTPHPEVYDLIHRLLGGELFEQRRDARVYMRGSLIPYPFQKFYHQLPDPKIVAECDEGLRRAGFVEPPEDFEAYIIGRFGSGIARHFMLPYNRKLWAREVTEISCEWTSERVAAPKGETERFETSGGERRPLQPDTYVAYPNTGGFEEIYRAFVPHIPALELQSEVVAIRPEERIARTADGRTFEWEFLVSTLPLPLLVRIVEGVPAEVRALADKLDYLSLRVELLLTRGPLDTSIQRIYTADADIPPHKIALNHNSSDHLRSKPKHAIMAEASIGPGKSVDVDEIAPRTIELLCDLGILDAPTDIEWSGHVDVEFGYPVYTHERPALVSGIKEWMEAREIYSVGRFGDWEYVNSDRCVAKGLTLGESLRERFPPVRTPAGARHESF